MAKHNWFFSLLTVAVSQSKEERRRAGDLLGRAGTCQGGLGPAGGAGARAVEGGGREVEGGGPGERPDPHPPPPHHQRARLGLSVQFGTEMYGFPKSSCRFISFPSLSFY